MSIRLKDVCNGHVSQAWLNRLIKEGQDANPTERGEKDKDLEREHTGAYLKRTRRKNWRSKCLR